MVSHTKAASACPLLLCWKQSTGYIPEDLQARHVQYVLNQKSKKREEYQLKNYVSLVGLDHVVS